MLIICTGLGYGRVRLIRLLKVRSIRSSKHQNGPSFCFKTPANSSLDERQSGLQEVLVFIK